MDEKECAINIIKTILSNGSTPESFNNLYEINSGNKEVLLGHITALRNIFTKAEKQLKKEIKEVE